MQNWNNEIPIPRESNYIIRVTGAEFKLSNAGNEMIVLEHEIVSPTSITYKGEEYNIAGVSAGLKSYHTVISHILEGENAGEVDNEKTAANAKRIEKLYTQYGVSMEGFNPSNPTLDKFVGIEVYAELDSEDAPRRRAPTPEQLAKGQKFGDILTHPITKKQLVDYYPKIKDVFGVVPKEGGV